MREDVYSKHFKLGHHTVHNSPGICNGIWSDMGIETNYMLYGKSRFGIIGFTLQPETLKTWAYSLNICTGIMKDLSDMAEGKSETPDKHKEEGTAWIKSDGKERDSLRIKLLTCIAH